MTINAIAQLCAEIRAPDSALLPAIRHAIDHKTKPLGALGQKLHKSTKSSWKIENG